MKYGFQIVDFKGIVAKVVEEMNPIAQAAKLTLSFETDGSESYLARLDAGKITQVVSNLIDNAMRYTPHGSIRVQLQHKPSAGSILLTIADTGVGIDTGTLKRLFQKFSKWSNG